jgi:hypothetical protein
LSLDAQLDALDDAMKYSRAEQSRADIQFDDQIVLLAISLVE